MKFWQKELKMRTMIKLITVASALVLSGAASAMTLQAAPTGGRGMAIVDPDEHLERLAAASNPAGGGHGKPRKSLRNVLRDDPQLRQAFAWLDNK